MLCGRRSLSPSAEETAAKERVRLAREQGLTLACGLTFCPNYGDVLAPASCPSRVAVTT